MNRQKQTFHPVWIGGGLFALLSFITHVAWIMLFDMAHIYDVIHVVPVVLLYDVFLEGSMVSPFLLLPVALVIDVLLGALIAWLLSLRIKDKTVYILSVIGGFAIYFIMITYQWLPLL